MVQSSLGKDTKTGGGVGDGSLVIRSVMKTVTLKTVVHRKR